MYWFYHDIFYLFYFIVIVVYVIIFKIVKVLHFTTLGVISVSGSKLGLVGISYTNYILLYK